MHDPMYTWHVCSGISRTLFDLYACACVCVRSICVQSAWNALRRRVVKLCGCVCVCTWIQQINANNAQTKSVAFCSGKSMCFRKGLSINRCGCINCARVCVGILLITAIDLAQLELTHLIWTPPPSHKSNNDFWLGLAVSQSVLSCAAVGRNLNCRTTEIHNICLSCILAQMWKHTRTHIHAHSGVPICFKSGEGGYYHK